MTRRPKIHFYYTLCNVAADYYDIEVQIGINGRPTGLYEFGYAFPQKLHPTIKAEALLDAIQQLTEFSAVHYIEHSQTDGGCNGYGRY